MSNTLLVLALVSAGMGGSLVLPSLAYIDMDNIVYRPLAKYGKAALWVVHRQVESDPAVIAFLAAVRGDRWRCPDGRVSILGQWYVVGADHR